MEKTLKNYKNLSSSYILFLSIVYSLRFILENQTDLFLYCKYSNRTSRNKKITSVFFILEHNTSIMGSMKSIIDKNLGNS